MTDILGATNKSLQAAKSVVNIASATSISGIENTITNVTKSITTGITDTFNSISKDVTNLLSTVGTGMVEVEMELPLNNVLHQYATYDYIISLGCLDADSFNYPGSSYMAGNLPPLICKSASGDPNNRIKLADGNKYDYFIEDLVIKANASFTEHTANTNTTGLEFTVIEPYSMGMFIQAVQIAAYNAGYSNWNEAPYLLMVEFRGNTDTGQLKTIQNTTKFITFNFNKWNMKVTEAGSVYSIEGYAATGKALTDSYTLLKSDATISGTTVQEILQSGPRSLQQVVNARYKELKDNGEAKVQDEILILFPINYSSTGSGSTLVKPGSTEQSSSSTTNPTSVNDQNLFKSLGVSRSSSSSTLVQNDGTCNELGKAKLGFDITRGGSNPFPDDNAVWDDAKKVWVRSEVCSKPGTTDFKFSQSSDIINSINQVLLKSELAVKALNSDQLTGEGFRPWWRVDTQTYHIASNANMKITGEIPKLVVYRVIPYKVHASKFLPPNAPAPGLTELKKQAAKEYNYIYTGKNIDILRFDFEIKNGFYTPFAADNFQKSSDVVTSQQMSTGIDKTVSEAEKVAPVIPTGGTPAKPGAMSYVTKFINTITHSDNKGGTRGDTEATRAAKLFHDAVMNSTDMMNITFDILGDPYYISNSGMGNYTAPPTQFLNVSSDGTMNYQNGEVHIVINFRTPSDINQTTGLYNLTNNSLCQQFSGLYKLVKIRSEFKHGQFTQSIDAMRIQGQDSTDTPSSSQLFSTAQQIMTNLGLSL